MEAAFLFDGDAFNFACALGLLDALAKPLADHRLSLHFVKDVVREIKGPNRDLIDRLEKQGSAHVHRIQAGDAVGRRFERLMKDRKKAKGGPVHVGECANVAWALESGGVTPIVVADKAGRWLAIHHGVAALRIHEFTFECVHRGLLDAGTAARCLETWQETQGRPPAFDFQVEFAAYLSG